ncbi:EpsG family protein [Chitinophaga jiangningensis]|uniref:EpsG family protein n=1 Tax=Chitinophaga jiangningensis TaxID=1419482 RepID=A0A1M7HIF2_9BACT|nr:EpsG family protein [Chitinophaga jiangningensis]SHM28234.1 EpsG family protein [Chitinophaga jiangningensis]
MVVYIVFFVLVAVLAILQSYTKKTEAKFFEWSLLLLLVCFAGLRDGLGTDTPAYKTIFTEISSYNETSYNVESGFFILNKYIAFLHGSFSLVLFVSALISAWFIVKAVNFVMAEYPSGKWLAYITFISIGVYWVYYFSGVRQGFTISIFLYSVRFIVERKFFRYLITIGFGMLFHNSILLMVPLYFIPRGRINSGLILISAVLAYGCARAGITDKVFEMAVGGLTGHYGGYAELFRNSANMDSGIGVILRVSVSLMLILISPYWVKDEKSAVICNIFSLGVVLYCFFLGVDILMRISEYMIDTMIFVMPLSLRAFDVKARSVFVVFSLLFLGALFYSNIHFDGMNLLPFKTVLW